MNARTQLVAQAARGPVLMITIGVLFAMHQAHVLSFGKTWPLVLIVLGVMKLMERVGAPPAASNVGAGPYAGPGYPAAPPYSPGPPYTPPPPYYPPPPSYTQAPYTPPPSPAQPPGGPRR